MNLPSFLKKYFWDVDFESIDSKRDQAFIIARLLEYGDTDAIRWLFKSVDQNKVKDVVLKSRGLSRKTVNFWSLFFKLDNSGIKCLKKSYLKMQSSHWHY